LPDYHEIIKEPTAISTLRHKIQTKKLTSVAEYVRDFALIVHNAQVYNRPNSSPVRDVLLLKAVFEEEMKKLVDQGIVAEEDTVFPDLGEIPYATPEPDPVSEEEDEGEDDGEEDDEDEDGDDSDDEKHKKRRRGARVSTVGRKSAKDEEEEGVKANDADPRKRRGRPPRVDTPMEARIKAILKGIRKPKDDAGQLKIRHFERLPDKQLFPHYFQEIKEPMALDMIKKRAKRKKYSTLEQFMKDLSLMFNNAMEYNQDDSDIYRDAVDLKAEAHKLLEIEKAKPDEEYMMEDGRLPLPNGILYKNELWKIGDWVHIQNPNDVTKPIVAQLYRTWQDPEGQKWVNACWYYRPEQTVHQFEKHFYPNEVVKTGQYRDHQIEEVIDRCFVMFFTRYNRGRPRNLDPETEVYVCEARYNEEKHKLNKIKTWASCLPDEVRDKDYEMDLFDAPRKIKKVPSPLLHLLKDDAKETDEAAQPEWGHPNAPPRVGAIHRQARDENVSLPVFSHMHNPLLTPRI
jgi:chromatin structure-remodeling complex subunit RSC1/2